MIVDFFLKVAYDIIDIFWWFKDKYVLKEDYQGVIQWQFSYTTFGYSLYGVTNGRIWLIFLLIKWKIIIVQSTLNIFDNVFPPK